LHLYKSLNHKFLKRIATWLGGNAIYKDRCGGGGTRLLAAIAAFHLSANVRQRSTRKVAKLKQQG
jgi:hypothetical protein